MTDRARKLLEDAMTLSEDERLDLAEQLLSSLPEDQEWRGSQPDDESLRIDAEAQEEIDHAIEHYGVLEASDLSGSTCEIELQLTRALASTDQPHARDPEPGSSIRRARAPDRAGDARTFARNFFLSNAQRHGAGLPRHEDPASRQHGFGRLTGRGS